MAEISLAYAILVYEQLCHAIEKYCVVYELIIATRRSLSKTSKTKDCGQCSLHFQIPRALESSERMGVFLTIF